MGDIPFLRVILATFLALSCAAIGIALTGGSRARLLIPLSGGLLAAVALFALLPETASGIGWPIALAAAAMGYALLVVFDRMGLPVCPSCSHGHGVAAPGFSISIVAATAIHAFVDGWGMMAIRSSSSQYFSKAVLAALLLHKIPEGLALGAILRGSTAKPVRAAAWATLAELPTLAGGFVGLRAAEAAWLDYPLALAAGAYLFLGLHAVLAWTRPAHTHAHHSHHESH